VSTTIYNYFLALTYRQSKAYYFQPMTDSANAANPLLNPLLSKKKTPLSNKTQGKIAGSNPVSKRRRKAPKPLARQFSNRPADSNEQAIYWHGKTLGELSRASGVALSTVSRIYNRIRRPSLDAAMCLATALGITIDALLTELFSDTKGSLAYLPKRFAEVKEGPKND
jgi:Helix-turn-helix